MTKPHEASGDTATVAFDPNALDFEAQYSLLSGTVLPRPIALVTTVGPNGINAAPFSYFNAVGQCPPMLMISIGPRSGGPKDTLANLRHLPELVVHIVNDANKERMNMCAVEYPTGVNELERAGLRTTPSVKVKPPRIIDCLVQLECRVEQILPLGSMPHHMVICEVVLFHYRVGLVDERLRVDLDRLDAIGRLSAPGRYSWTRDRFTMHTPSLRQAP